MLIDQVNFTESAFGFKDCTQNDIRISKKPFFQIFKSKSMVKAIDSCRRNTENPNTRASKEANLTPNNRFKHRFITLAPKFGEKISSPMLQRICSDQAVKLVINNTKFKSMHSDLQLKSIYITSIRHKRCINHPISLLIFQRPISHKSGFCGRIAMGNRQHNLKI